MSQQEAVKTSVATGPRPVPVVLKQSQSPCGMESTLWRECLKEFNYGPDRKKDACLDQRKRFYSCMSEWRKKNNVVDEDQKAATSIPKKCASKSEELHKCMMIWGFEMAKCQNESLKLKVCCAEQSPEIFHNALGDDPQYLEYLAKKKDQKTNLGKFVNLLIGRWSDDDE